MIIGNSTQGTTRDKISNLRGEKVDETQGNLGSHYRNDDLVNNIIQDTKLMEEIDPDDRGADYEDEKDWKDFY